MHFVAAESRKGELCIYLISYEEELMVHYRRRLNMVSGMSVRAARLTAGGGNCEGAYM